MDGDTELLAILTELGSYKFINNENEEIINHNIKNINNNKAINENINSNNKKQFNDHKKQINNIEQNENVNKIYECGENVLEAARALYRSLNEDDEIDRSVFHYLGRIDIARHKLVPLLITFPDNTNLVTTLLKIYVKLTLQLPYHIESYDIPKQTLYSLNLKEAFINKELISTLLMILKGPMTSLALSNGTNQDYIIIELILTLIKNMLQIQDPISSQSFVESEYRCHMHNDLIEILEEEGILELFLVLAQNIQTHKVYKLISIYSLLLLEIFTLLLKNDTPNEIWSSKGDNEEEEEEEETVKNNKTNTTTTNKSKSSRGSSENSLLDLLKKEKKLSTKLVSNSNRSRFVGTYSSFSNNEGKKIINKTLPDMATVQAVRPTNLSNFSASLLSTRTKVIGERKKTPSSPAVRFILKNWSEQFLDGCYNVLMNIIIQEFARDDTGQILESDRINFLLLTKFFTGFSLSLLRHHNSKQEELKLKKQQQKEQMAIDGLVEQEEDEEELIDDNTHDNIIGSLSSTLSPSNFQFIFSSCDCYIVAKKNLSLEVGVSTLREMISLLNYMSTSPIKQYNKISYEMQSAIYYDRDAFLKLVITLLRSYQPTVFSRSMILDLIDLSFTTVNMVENFCSRHNSIVIKSKKQSRRAKHLGEEDDKTVKQDNEGDDSDSDYKPDEEEKEDELDQEHLRDSMEFNSFMGEFAHSDIIKNLALVLGGYHANSKLLNYQIIEIFKRIAKDLDLEPLFYQLSLFYLFKNLLNDPLISSSKADSNSKELVLFINQILDNYFKSVESNPSFLIDILLTKHKTDCFNLNLEKYQHDNSDDGEVNELKISEETGRLKKLKKPAAESDEGEKFLESDNEGSEKDYILQGIVSKLEDSLDKEALTELIFGLVRLKMGPPAIEWIQNHLLAAINIRNDEKNQPKFTLYRFLYEGEHEHKNYNSTKQVRSIFMMLKFLLPSSRDGFYSIPQFKTYTSFYLTTINETIKSALVKYKENKQKLELEKKLKLKSKSVIRPKFNSKGFRIIYSDESDSDYKSDGLSEEEKEEEKVEKEEEVEETEEARKKRKQEKKEKKKAAKKLRKKERKAAKKKQQEEQEQDEEESDVEPLIHKSDDEEDEKEEKVEKAVKKDVEKSKKKKIEVQQEEDEEESDVEPLIHKSDDEEEEEEEKVVKKKVVESSKKKMVEVQQEEDEEESDVEPLIHKSDDEEESDVEPLIHKSDDEEEEEKEVKPKPPTERKGLLKKKPQSFDDEEEEEIEDTPIYKSTNNKVISTKKQLLDEEDEEDDMMISNKDLKRKIKDLDSEDEIEEEESTTIVKKDKKSSKKLKI